MNSETWWDLGCRIISAKQLHGKFSWKTKCQVLYIMGCLGIGKAELKFKKFSTMGEESWGWVIKLETTITHGSRWFGNTYQKDTTHDFMVRMGLGK